jgi:hypothetical protein
MKEDTDELSALWRKGKSDPGIPSLLPGEIISQAQANKKKSMEAHYWNMGILAAVAVMIAFSIVKFFPFATTLSHVGVAMMIGVLVVRIGIEAASLARAGRVRFSDPSVRVAEESLAFYRLRKKLHGPVTISLVGLYLLGWFLLTPEWSLYIPMKWMIIMDGGSLVIAAVLILVIRKGVRQELEDLRRMVELQQQLR